MSKFFSKNKNSFAPGKNVFLKTNKQNGLGVVDDPLQKMALNVRFNEVIGQQVTHTHTHKQVSNLNCWCAAFAYGDIRLTSTKNNKQQTNDANFEKAPKHVIDWHGSMEPACNTPERATFPENAQELRSGELITLKEIENWN